MERRRVLSIIAATAGVSIAGCSGDPESGSGNSQSQSTDTTSPSPNQGDESTPTESPTDIDTQTPTESGEPEFVVESVDIPEEVEIGEEWSWAITIANTGEVGGTFRTEVTASIGDSDFQRLGEIELEIPAGETATYESETATTSYLTQATLRFEEFDLERDVNVVTRSLTFGEPYQNPEGIVTVAHGIDLQSSYTYEGYDGSEETETAGDGMMWAFLEFEATNDGGSPEYVPSDSDISIITGNQQYNSTYINKEEGQYESDEIQPGITRRGWIAYEIPNDLTGEDLSVAYSDGDF